MLRSSVFTKNLVFCRNLLCFVSLCLPRSGLVLVAYNSKNIPAFLISIEIIHPRQYNIQLRFMSLYINYLG